MTKDSRTLSLEMDADSQGGTPRDPTPDTAAMPSMRHPSDDASQSSEGCVFHSAILRASDAEVLSGPQLEGDVFVICEMTVCTFWVADRSSTLMQEAGGAWKG